MCARLRTLIEHAHQRGVEIQQMLAASFNLLNADYGFSLSLTPPPDLERYLHDLDLIEHNYVQYLGITQAVRLSQPKFMEQFRRMLVSKLRVVFENASGELELWNKTASSQVDSQLRERRRGFKRRREALERIQSAAGELEQRIGEFEAQDARFQQFQAKGKRAHAVAAPSAEPAGPARAGRADPSHERRHRREQARADARVS